MNKTAFKLFLSFSIVAVSVTLILLFLNAFAFAIVASDDSTHIFDRSPQGIIAEADKALIKTNGGFSLADDVIPNNCWCILLNENGDIIWSENQPADIPVHYSINDIARLTRWFLNDYPVYVRATDYGLMILGIPKNSIGKYDIVYSMKWFDTLPQRLSVILIINVSLALLLVLLLGTNLYRQMKRLVNGINDLKEEKAVNLPEHGLFGDVHRSINAAAQTIERKNLVLAQRDSARSNWISGISHDIRTPLSIIMGYSEELANSTDFTEKEKIRAINLQSVKIKKLIDDLNLISSLEYDMQPLRKKAVRVCPLLRRVVAEAMNSPRAEIFEFEMRFGSEKAAVYGDEQLLERAVFNIIANSIEHNENGCKITVSQYSKNASLVISVRDSGRGVTEDVITNISEIPKGGHGMGLPMAYRIITAHGGKFIAKNDGGFLVEMTL